MKRKMKTWAKVNPETMYAIVYRNGSIRGVMRPELFTTRAEARCKMQSLLPSPAKRIARVRITEARK